MFLKFCHFAKAVHPSSHLTCSCLLPIVLTDIEQVLREAYRADCNIGHMDTITDIQTDGQE